VLNTMTDAQVEKGLSTVDGIMADTLVKHQVETRRMRKWLETKIAAGAKKAFTEIVTVTPVLSALLLERNTINRPKNKRGLKDLKLDIEGGRFQFNGQSIIVSDTGTLNDGQHRCETVLVTGVPIESVMVFGPSEESRKTTDTGKVKTVSNFLAMEGRGYSKIVSSAANYLLQIRDLGNVNHANQPTKSAVLAYANEITGIDSSIELTYEAAKTIGSHAVVAACHYSFWKRSSRVAADEFILKLIHGNDLKSGDPILYCRNKLLSYRNSIGHMVRVETKFEIIFKCWNAHRRGETKSSIRLTGGALPKLEK